MNCEPNNDAYYSYYDIYWRIGAILSAISSFFSVFIILYFLIIREHPDRPDTTDPIEREQFHNIQSNNGNNLCNEILSKIRVNCMEFKPLKTSFFSYFDKNNLKKKKTDENKKIGKKI
jgi:hypothetical protein